MDSSARAEEDSERRFTKRIKDLSFEPFSIFPLGTWNPEPGTESDFASAKSLSPCIRHKEDEDRIQFQASGEHEE